MISTIEGDETFWHMDMDRVSIADLGMRTMTDRDNYCSRVIVSTKMGFDIQFGCCA